MKIPNINYTLKADLCTGCGLCEGVCPSKAIKTIVKDGRFIPYIDLSMCKNEKGCHRCYDVCPGLGVNLTELSNECFQDPQLKEDKHVGKYLKCFAGHSNDYDIRYHSASGGMVTQFLIWLLEQKLIDGAVVTCFDPQKPLMVKTFIATTKDEIIASRSSKYSPVSFNHVAQDIKAAKGNRYVVVGIPCHIEGMRKLMKIDKRLKEKVVGLFAIYCSSGRTFYLTEKVFADRGINKEHITYFQYRDEGCLGKMVVKYPQYADTFKKAIPNNAEKLKNEKEVIYKEHFQSYYHPLRSIFVPKRCVFCIDHFGELGDVCFGDIHTDPYKRDKIGVNSIIVKNKYWLNLLEDCYASGCISLEEIPYEIALQSQKMARIKKGRNGAFVFIAKVLGQNVPQYDVDYLRKPDIYDWVDFIQNRFQQFVGKHKWMWWIIPLIKKEHIID